MLERYASSGLAKNPESNPEFKNVIKLETHLGKYDIVYGDHELRQDPGVLKGSDALVLEMSTDYSKTETLPDLVTSIQNHWQQYKEVIEYAKKNEIPIYFIDLINLDAKNVKVNMPKQALEKDFYGDLFAGLAAGGVLITAGDQLMLKQEKAPSRRAFLAGALSTTAFAAMSGYNKAPEVLMNTARNKQNPDENSFKRKWQRLLVSANEKLHPDIFKIPVSLRNAIFAQKSEFIASQLKARHRNGKPKLTLVLGAVHTGVENALAESAEKRQEFINSELQKTNVDESLIARIVYKNKEDSKPQVDIFRDEKIKSPSSQIARL